MSRARCVGVGCWVGWGGIIINVVVALKCVTCCGCFEDPCSASRARCVGVGWGGGAGRDNYKCCSCIEGVTRCGCFEDPCSMSRASMLTYTR